MDTPNLNKAKENIGENLVEKLRKAAKDDKFSNTGKLDKSFGYKVISDKINVFAQDYAGALSGGINNKKNPNKDMVNNLAEWARSKGMQPLLRKYTSKTVNGVTTYKNTGRFRKVTESSYKSLGYILARSIAKKGIVKRFGYKGSGFIERVIKEQEKNVEVILTNAFKKDIIYNLKNK